jgi:MoaA/NifB/PqqE/SkfB family radical SAM enzyme
MQYEINDLHLELSSLCNARCPFCLRNVQGYPADLGLNETNLSFADFRKTFTPQRLGRVSKTLINGNFGDFVMNPESIDIIKYLRHSNHDMNIRIHTNGSARDRAFWHDLGTVGTDVVFGIDGIGDTNALYRQDTNFDNIIRNAEIFIKAGGNAIWCINQFDHNQEQMPEVHALAEKIGFSEVLVRPTLRDNGPVYNRQGQKVVKFKTDWDWPDKIDNSFIEIKIAQAAQHQQNKKTVKIDCWAIRARSVYMAADGHVYPCCWTGYNPTEFRTHTGYSQWNKELVKYIAHNHAPSVGLEAALMWFDDLSAAWSTDDQPRVCQHNCQHDNTNTNSSS